MERMRCQGEESLGGPVPPNVVPPRLPFPIRRPCRLTADSVPRTGARCWACAVLASATIPSPGMFSIAAAPAQWTDKQTPSHLPPMWHGGADVGVASDRPQPWHCTRTPHTRRSPKAFLSPPVFALQQNARPTASTRGASQVMRA